MLQGEHSAILSTFIKLPFVIKTFVLSIFERPFYTGFTVQLTFLFDRDEHADLKEEMQRRRDLRGKPKWIPPPYRNKPHPNDV